MTWSAPPPPQRPPRRHDNTAIWVVAALAVVLVLVRIHHIEVFYVLMFLALLPSVILHEVSHGVVALAFGDDTAKRAGRLTLNPVRHIDPFGSVILPALLALSVGYAFGWAKPVPVSVNRLRHPRNDNVAVALVGPAVNVGLAVLFALAYRFLVPAVDKFPPVLDQATWVQFVYAAGYVNVILAVFNLIPLPPLDGSAVVERFLPAHLLPGYYRIRPFTMFIPLLVVILFPSALAHLFDPALDWWSRLLV